MSFSTYNYSHFIHPHAKHRINELPEYNQGLSVPVIYSYTQRKQNLMQGILLLHPTHKENIYFNQAVNHEIMNGPQRTACLAKGHADNQ